MILAHELGHHVGLLHVEDDADLMSAQVLRFSPSAVGFSPSQVRALRMHPSVRFSDEPMQDLRARVVVMGFAADLVRAKTAYDSQAEKSRMRL